MNQSIPIINRNFRSWLLYIFRYIQPIYSARLKFMVYKWKDWFLYRVWQRCWTSLSWSLTVFGMGLRDSHSSFRVSSFSVRPRLGFAFYQISWSSMSPPSFNSAMKLKEALILDGSKSNRSRIATYTSPIPLQLSIQMCIKTGMFYI